MANWLEFLNYFFKHDPATFIIEHFDEEEAELSKKTLINASPDVEKPNKSKLELFRYGLIYFVIELMFSIEVALTVPLMLKLQVSEDLYSYVYFISPLIGFVAQPILGAYSDRWGQRKPFIFVLAIGAYIGISLILNGYFIGQIFGDKGLNSQLIGIILVGVGVTLLDFSADSCDSPLRAYLLDVCNPRAQETGLNIHAFLGGLGASLGYILTYIDWENSVLNFFGDEMQILFVLSSVVFFVCLFVTMSAIKEKTLIKNEVESADRPEQVIISLHSIFINLFEMPTELRRLIVCQTLGWLAFFSTQLFFTDFIAQSIYKGNPSYSIESDQFKLYNHGVKMGCIGLLVFSLSSSVFALIMERYLIEKVSYRSMYLVTFILYVISCIIIYNLENILFIIPLCSGFGILFTILTTLPYRIISEFHQDQTYLHQSSNRTKRGIGTDCSLMGSCFFLAQAIISMFMGFLTYKYGNRVIMIVGALFGSAGYVYARFYVIFPQKCNDKII